MEFAQLGERPDAVLIAGPTASGKSAFAIEQAEKWDGVVINADSMQVYPVLRVLTARPGDRELALVPHRLYGHASLSSSYSVALWLVDVALVIEELSRQGKIPVFVGGTGLYFKALGEGLAVIPEIPDVIRSRLRRQLDDDGVAAIHEALVRCDPKAANRLKPGDGQRNLRALEVFQATGQSILYYQSEGRTKPLLGDGNALRFVMLPERSALHRRIETRFDQMLNKGALDEVKELRKIDVADDHPVKKAIGVKQLSRYLDGEITLDAARELSLIATRQYAKRQSTWFRNQLDEHWVVCR